MTEKRETAGGQRYPSRITIPVPRGQAPRVLDVPPSSPPDAPPLTAPERTVETPLDLSGVTEVPEPVNAFRTEDISRPVPSPPPPMFPAQTSDRPVPEHITSVAAPPVFTPATTPATFSVGNAEPSWVVSDLRAEIAFYRRLVVGLLGALFLLTMLLAWSLARGRA